MAVLGFERRLFVGRYRTLFRNVTVSLDIDGNCDVF